jgi:hypothetical protein
VTKPDRTRIRIDYVFAAGPSETLASEIVGEIDGAVAVHRRTL